MATLIPFDLAIRADKKTLINSSAFQGLRAYIRRRKGESLSDRVALNYRAFMRHAQAGQVLALLESGFAWVPKSPEDKGLVLRWPEGATPPTREQKAVFTLPE